MLVSSGLPFYRCSTLDALQNSSSWKQVCALRDVGPSTMRSHDSVSVNEGPCACVVPDRVVGRHHWSCAGSFLVLNIGSPLGIFFYSDKPNSAYRPWRVRPLWCLTLFEGLKSRMSKWTLIGSGSGYEIDFTSPGEACVLDDECPGGPSRHSVSAFGESSL